MNGIAGKSLRKVSTKKNKSRTSKRCHNLFIYRLKLFLFYTIVMSIILFVGLMVISTTLFKISKIEVLNNGDKYKEEEIINYSGIELGENLIFLNKSLCEKNIYTQMPYIGSVRINRYIPNKVSIKVEDAIPFSMVYIDGIYLVLDKNNKVIEERAEPNDDLLIVKGIDISNAELSKILEYNNNEKFNIYSSLVNSIDAIGLDNILEINLINPLDIYINYDNRIKIVLGSSENIDYKLRVADKIIKESVPLNESGILDVSLSYEDNHSYFTPSYII